MDSDGGNESERFCGGLDLAFGGNRNIFCYFPVHSSADICYPDGE